MINGLAAPGIITPFLRQTNVHGPLPPGTVAKPATSPTQRVRLASGVAVIFVSRMSEAEFVAAPQTPVTSTEYVATLRALAGASARLLVVAPEITAPF